MTVETNHRLLSRRRHDLFNGGCRQLCIGFLLLLLLSTLENSYAKDTASTHAPSIAPTIHHATTHKPSHHHNGTTTGWPSQSPSKSFPTLEPTVHRNHTVEPTPVDHVPTVAPSKAAVTSAPTPHTTPPPTVAPSPASPMATATPSAPTVTTSAPSSTPVPPKRRVSIWRILGKTLGWLILIALSVLLFGAIMSNRYQIYYHFKATLRHIRRMECTRWMLQKTGLSRFFGDDSGGASLNEVIFDRGDLTEGLLMTGEDQS